MANLASFDENGLRQKLTESREGIEEVCENGIQTDTDLYELLDGIDTGVSAAIALVQRGYATPEQEEALYTYLHNQGVI